MQFMILLSCMKKPRLQLLDRPVVSPSRPIFVSFSKSSIPKTQDKPLLEAPLTSLYEVIQSMMEFDLFGVRPKHMEEDHVTGSKSPPPETFQASSRHQDLTLLLSLNSLKMHILSYQLKRAPMELV